MMAQEKKLVTQPPAEALKQPEAEDGAATKASPPERTSDVRSGFPMATPPFIPGQEDVPNDVDEWTAVGTGPEGDGPVDPEAVKASIVATLKTVYDPEIPVNIYDLGLIYDLLVSTEGDVEVQMTLTAPGCPVAGALVKEVAEKSGTVPGVRKAHVKLTWDPPWDMDRMTEEARLELGLL